MAHAVSGRRQSMRVVLRIFASPAGAGLQHSGRMAHRACVRGGLGRAPCCQLQVLSEPVLLMAHVPSSSLRINLCVRCSGAHASGRRCARAPKLPAFGFSLWGAAVAFVRLRMLNKLGYLSKRPCLSSWGTETCLPYSRSKRFWISRLSVLVCFSPETSSRGFTCVSRNDLCVWCTVA